MFIGFLMFAQVLAPLAYAADSEHDQEQNHNHNHKEHNQTHSDDLLTLLGYKIKLQKLQSEHTENTTNLDQQGRLLQRAMPVLNSYMAKPKSYYLTTEMYRDSLENRAAMLTDFSDILVKYQKLLVSSR